MEEPNFLDALDTPPRVEHSAYKPVLFKRGLPHCEREHSSTNFTLIGKYVQSPPRAGIGSQLFIGAQVTRAHLSCHGKFDVDDPLASAVILADTGEEGVTAREWMRLRLDADLVTLSACQLAFSETNRGDDLVGMARALFYWHLRTATRRSN